jgi:hypothetical protein
LQVEHARISDITQPFNRQPDTPKDFDLYGSSVTLYDGYELQKLFPQTIHRHENSLDHIHIIFTDLLVCTFSDDDMRYHARAVVCGTPSIISIPGIVEAPARPKEFYFNIGRGQDAESAKKSVAGRFLDYGDQRIVGAAANYTLQAIFFFLTEGEAFCDNSQCRLFNAHWQEDLLRTLRKPVLCQKHIGIADKFNRWLEEMKRKEGVYRIS